jgi:nucleoside-triphosphatase THEP1
MQVTIISAEKNSGKTTYAKHLIEGHEMEYLGFLSLSDPQKKEFYLQDINDGKKILIMSEYGNDAYEKLGRFYLEPNGFDIACDTLFEEINISSESKTVLIDEVGRLELRGKGFNALINKLIEMDIDLVLCVRKSFVSEVIRKYGLANCHVINVEYDESFQQSNS